MEHPPRFAALLLAAGRSARLGRPKPYLQVAGRTLLEWNARKLALLPGHAGTIVTMDEASLRDHWPALREKLEVKRVGCAVLGGDTRQESTRIAFRTAERIYAESFEIVLVQDCARPFFPLAQTREALALAADHGAAILGYFARDTIKEVDADGRVRATLRREAIFQAATPQVFRRAEFVRMLDHAAEHGIIGSDESSLAEVAGVEVHVVDSPSTNVKLTHSEDLTLLPGLAALLEETEKDDG